MTLTTETTNAIQRQIELLDQIGQIIIKQKDVVPDQTDINIIYQEVNKDLRQQRIYKKKHDPDSGRTFYCSKCGKEITVPVAGYSKTHYGERLCQDCQKKTPKLEQHI